MAVLRLRKQFTRELADPELQITCPAGRSIMATHIQVSAIAAALAIVAVLAIAVANKPRIQVEEGLEIQITCQVAVSITVAESKDLRINVLD